MNGWTFWIEQGGGYRIVDVPIAAFARAEAAALRFASGDRVESYTRRSNEWMRKLYGESGAVMFVVDTNLKATRGFVKRWSGADTPAARS